MHRFLRRPVYDASARSWTLGRQGVFALMSKIAPGVATLLINILIGRLGGSTLLGLTQSLVSTAALGSLLYPTGAGSAASRFVATSRAVGDRGLTSASINYLSTRTALAIAGLSVGIAVALWGTRATDTSSMFVAALLVAGISSRAFLEGLHYGAGHGARLAWWAALMAGASAVGVMVLLVSGVRSAWVISPVALSACVFAVFSWPARSANANRPPAREIRSFIWIATIGSLASAGFAQATVLMATFAEGVAFAGQYAAAMTLTTPVALLAAAVSAIAFPSFAASHARQSADEVRNRIRVITDALVSVLGLAFIPMATLATSVTRVVWGQEFESTAQILLITLPVAVVSAIAVPAVTALTSSSNRGMITSAISSLVGMCVGIVAWLVMLPAGVELAVPLGYAVGTVIIAGIPTVLVWRRYGLRWLHELLTVVAMVSVPIVASVTMEMLGTPLLVKIVAGGLMVVTWLLLRRGSVRRVRAAIVRAMDR